MTHAHTAVPLRRTLGTTVAASLLALTLAACVTTSAAPSSSPIPPGDGAPPTAPATAPGPPSVPPTAPTTPMPGATSTATSTAPAATVPPSPTTATTPPAATSPPVPASTPASTPRPTPRPTAAVLGTIAGHALAGPTCPVEKFPPDPRCADKPVVGAEIVVTDADGREVARTRTSIDGGFAVSLPPGMYAVAAQPVEGYMRAPGPESVTVTAGDTVTVDLAYDTGIR